ncbi:TetR/AcrR family transcriptional regulator [Labrys wisconsinensis]|uniref:AcrR family transcriptional regulator n=1 Tax=Labrys wisconsinensis TaxID=425677 RepID=A0ABU0JEK2_9HYPH|nr:CerR family C-terminal domain-containing protein [Labrys wisconsinensis]MDQ0472701.1 AcrR family transcriptional regulator [Labrys wisconsinensis]
MPADSRRPLAVPDQLKAGDRVREVLLQAAGEVFAEKGYDRATSKEICERAGVNSAAVNYHFGGIDALYMAALRRAHQRLTTIEALWEIASSTASPQDKLRAYIAPIVRWLASPASATWEMRVLGREIVSPSPLREAFVETEILPKIRLMRGIIGELMGVPPDDAIVGRAMLTAVAPCILMAVANRSMLETILPSLADPETEIPRLVEHYERFIRAGLEAVAEQSRAESRG